ncbi:uncharacterized protein DS421_19g638430 [Arachis hypogaea]|uniref:Uncharacterized protein n=1 Tax=Arachis hypogaea TaxID=3818 RepID=A0A6B9V6H7_ARAHY|nr:uncharacterized protein DS421_19g638430 [Arachis hypogaea]
MKLNCFIFLQSSLIQLKYGGNCVGRWWLLLGIGIDIHGDRLLQRYPLFEVPYLSLSSSLSRLLPIALSPSQPKRGEVVEEGRGEGFVGDEVEGGFRFEAVVLDALAEGVAKSMEVVGASSSIGVRERSVCDCWRWIG